MSSPTNDSVPTPEPSRESVPDLGDLASPGAATPRDSAATPVDSTPFDVKSTAYFEAKKTIATLPVPIEFGKYLMLQQLAKGGMGIVYKARDIVLGRIVALKMIRSGVLASSDEVERFYREAQAIANLKHPNIVQILDYGNLHGNHYFTMALADQGSLTKHLDRFRAKPREAVMLVQKVARAVQHVHEKGILHRDLKPGNILLEAGDEPLVSDFGLSKIQPAPGAGSSTDLGGSDDLTNTGEAPGTPAYMAPEQLPPLAPPSKGGEKTNGSPPSEGGAGGVGPATDVWALGVVLYEVLTGRRPFAGNSRDEVTTAIRESDPIPPRKLESRIDRSLETIVLKCLEKDPSRRYLSAGALADDLGCWLRGEPIRARPMPWWRRGWRTAKRHPWVARVAIVGVLALAAIVVIRRFNNAPPLGPIDTKSAVHTFAVDPIVVSGKKPLSGGRIYGLLIKLDQPEKPILKMAENDGPRYVVNFGIRNPDGAFFEPGRYLVRIRNEHGSFAESEISIEPPGKK